MSETQRPASLSARDVLYEAARVACLAPSIANSQPWRWRIRGDTLELHADRARQLTDADPQGRSMIISCGAVLHHATVVLAVLGAAATAERINDPADPDLLARLTLAGPHQVTAEDMRLHHALRTRCTDQRPFLGIGPLPDEVIDLLRHAAEPFEVSTHALDPSQADLLTLAARSTATAGRHVAGYQDEMPIWTTRPDVTIRDDVPKAGAGTGRRRRARRVPGPDPRVWGRPVYDLPRVHDHTRHQGGLAAHGRSAQRGPAHRHNHRAGVVGDERCGGGLRMRGRPCVRWSHRPSIHS